MTNTREVAFEALLTIEKDNKYSNSFLSDVLNKYSFLDKQDRSFLDRLLRGTIERKITLDYIISQYSKTPVNKIKPPVRVLLRMGIYQIMYMDSVPDSAAVNEMVKIAKKRGLSGLTGFINGILRNVARGKETIEYPNSDSDTARYLSVFYSCPQWIVEMFIKQHGTNKAKAVLENSVSVRPITARVNITNISRDELIAKYPDNMEIIENIPCAVRLHNIDTISELEAINKGEIVVQDISSMLVGIVAGIDADMTVMDVCASPGGKTMHAADIASKGKIISCDVSEEKAARIRENIDRCGFNNVEVRVSDATVYDEDLKGLADVLIADVPCSGLGVIGRKNDIKLRLTADQLGELVILQRRILSNVVRYVKPGGTLMFSTCTVNVEENLENFRFLTDELNLVPIDFYNDLPVAFRDDTAKEGYLQLYGENGLSDGFFISKLKVREA